MNVISGINKSIQIFRRFHKVVIFAFMFPILMMGYTNCGQFDVNDQTLFSKFPPKVLNIKVKKYCPASGSTFKQYFVINASSVVTAEGNFTPDSDRDGLSDDFEENQENRDVFGIGPDGEDLNNDGFLDGFDTNSDGYNDFLMVKAGYKKDDQKSLPNCPNGYSFDADKDNLNDCEEDLLGTDKDKVDSDGDLIPDDLEFKFGMNPLYANDAAFDPDVDGLSNLEELKKNSPRFLSNSLLMLPYPPVFQNELVISENTNLGSCYNLTVKNIPVMNVKNGNDIRIIFIEDNAGQHQAQKMSAVIASEIKNDTMIEFDFKDGEILTFTNRDVPVEELFEGDQK
ncbi:MAG: hypothetical protein SGI74_04135 [Oligoflexia bacterium]|nr:hypothetical protein [Oligoflexia bacterium]